MLNSSHQIILGSQSPQRRSLLQSLVPDDRIRIVPPADSEEAGFEGLAQLDEISTQLQSIARTKSNDVYEQCRRDDWSVILTADTVVVAHIDETNRVLGKPDGESWKETVRIWFQQYYSGSSHLVQSAVCFRFPDGSEETCLSSTTVHFDEISQELLEWYIQTEEPLGKAGGYGIQAAGSLFVKSVEGSLSNVIGLPIEVVWQVLKSHQIT